MAGPGNVVANASPIPTGFFPDATSVQMQSVGNTGTGPSFPVDYTVREPGTARPPVDVAPERFVWPWQHWAPLIAQVKERFGA